MTKYIKAGWNIIVVVAWWTAIMMFLGVCIGLSSYAVYKPIEFIWRTLG